MTTSPRPLSIVAVLLLVAAVAAAGAVLLRSSPRGDGDAASTAAPATLVFAEFGPTADRIYTAPAEDPARRTLVATVDHAEGWGIVPAQEMAGSVVAYTVLPPGSAPLRDARAELWLLDVDTGDRTRLARDADLLIAPRFDRDGAYLAYRASGPKGEQLLVRVDLATRARRVLHTYEGSFGVFPVGFAPDGALLFARLSRGGTDVFATRDGEEPRLLFHASDDIARDWRLSPDGRFLSYLAPQLLAERVVHRLRVVELAGGSERSVEGAGATAEQFAPVWTPRGDSVTVGREALPGISAAAVTLSLGGEDARALPEPQRGFDAPLAWSPDGRYLVARSFDGVSAYRPGRETMVVISAEGPRRVLASRGELTFLGWLARG